MALPIPGLRSLPLPSPPSPPSSPLPLPDRALTPTLRRVELAAWTVSVLLTTTLVAFALAGAFVVASQPLTLPMGALLAAVLVGTLGFAVADVVLG